jgi:hypothetical protein
MTWQSVYFGDFAIIHVRTSYQKPDGAQGAGRYTDDWQLRTDLQCAFAHVDAVVEAHHDLLR